MNPSELEELGLRLHSLRVASGLSGEKFAAQIGFSRSSLYRFEKGHITEVDHLNRIQEWMRKQEAGLAGKEAS